MSDATRKEKMVAVGRLLYKKYRGARIASRRVPESRAASIARELHYQIFYTDYTPNPAEDIVYVPHPLLR
jgi:hypothetical protein